MYGTWSPYIEKIKIKRRGFDVELMWEMRRALPLPIQKWSGSQYLSGMAKLARSRVI